MEDVTMHKSNLATALSLAIKAQEKYEREELNYGQDSALVAGWREILEAIKDGNHIDVI